MTHCEDKPTNCRNRLRDEGKPYPKSGCYHCKDGGLNGCPYEEDIGEDSTKLTFEEFYKQLENLLNKAANSGISMDRINVANHFTLDGSVHVSYIEINGLKYEQ